MPPQTKPVNARFAELQKAAKTFMDQSQKAGKVNAKQQATASAGAVKANRENLQSLKSATAELKKHNKLLKENAALAKRGDGGGKGGAGGGRGRQSVASALGLRKWMGPAAIASIVGSVVGLVSSQVRASIDTFAGTVKTQRDVAGMISQQKITALTRGAQPLGFGPQEVLGAVQGVGRAVGVRRPGEFPAGGVAQLLKAQQQFGINQGEGVSMMGEIRRAGITGFDVDQQGKRGAGLRTFQRIMADGVASGLEKTRVPEHMQNVAKGMQQVGENISGVVDAAGISSMMTMLGKMGAGFQGKRGQGVMNAFQNLFASVASGKATGDVSAMVLQDVGGFGGPASTNSYTQALRQLDKGISDPENFKNLIRGANRRYSVEGQGGQMAALALSRETGISFTKSEELVKLGNQGFEGNAELDARIRAALPETLDVNEKAVELAAGQAQVQLQQFEIGKQLLDVVLRIQVLIGQIVSESIPAIRSMLLGVEDLVILTKEAVAFWKDYFGDKQSGETSERMKEVERIKETVPRDLQASAIYKVLKEQREDNARLAGLDIGSRQQRLRTGALSNQQKANIKEQGTLAAGRDTARAMQSEINIIRKREETVKNRKIQADAEAKILSQKIETETASLQKEAAEKLADATTKADKLYNPFMKLAQLTEDTSVRAGQSADVGQGGDEP